MRTQGRLVDETTIAEMEPESIKSLFCEKFSAGAELTKSLKMAGNSSLEIERRILSSGITRENLLRCLSRVYSLPFVEYGESLTIPSEFLNRCDFESLKKEAWCPLSQRNGTCTVAAFDVWDEGLFERIREHLGVERIKLVIALPSDIVRMVENSYDVNPCFPWAAGRNQLAELRTWLAGERVKLAQFRTTLAKGRTGLAQIRTGIAFISIGLVLLRVLGFGYLSVVEGFLVLCGIMMASDGMRWYLPARKIDKDLLEYTGTEPTFGSTVLQVSHAGESQKFSRTPKIENAEKLRSAWNRLTPVMKRRFMASDRTDLAEERTILASYRTRMARARTGLAFTRTGISLIGLGVALIRQFHAGYWSILDASLIITGTIMVSEGFHWNIPERKAGKSGLDAVKSMEEKRSIWTFMFPPHHRQPASDEQPGPLSFNRELARGIWGTTGLALERTLIADKRNVKSRLRTIMARSRTGMAFIRTGASIFSVGFGLMVYFGTGSTGWTVFNSLLLVIGLGGIIDGFYWHLPARRMQESFGYCDGDLEITLADYGEPAASWKKVVFTHEDI